MSDVSIFIKNVVMDDPRFTAEAIKYVGSNSNRKGILVTYSDDLIHSHIIITYEEIETFRGGPEAFGKLIHNQLLDNVERGYKK